MGINANYMTLNPLYLINNSYPPNAGSYVKDGNLTVLNAVSNFGIGMTHGFYSGKWYWEILLADKGQFLVGFLTTATFTNQKSQPHNTTGSYLVYTDTSNQGQKVEENSFITLANFNAGDGDIIGLALDRDNRKFWVSLNGTFINSGDPAGGSNPVFDSGDITATTGEFRPIIGTYGGQNVKMTLNAGQDSSFVGQKTSGSANATDGNSFGDFYYTPPTGYLSACQNNIPTSDDIDPAQTDDNIPGKNFNVVTFNGNGTTNAVTGLGFQPDLIWGFTRSGSQSKRLVDSTRGGSSRLYSDLTSSESTGTATISSFDSDGFTATGGAFNNDSGKTCGAWCWKANGGTTTSDSSGDITVTRQTNDVAKFSILTYTGNGSSGSTIAHGLGVKPAMTIIKQRNSTNGWNVWHQGNNNGDYDSFGELNGNASWYQNQGSNGPFSAAPGTDYLTLTAYGQVNGSSNTYVSYVWADVEGMQKFGSFEGNANNDGPFIYTGFRPRMVFIKSVDTTAPWMVWDTARATFNVINISLAWNDSLTESDYTGYPIDVLSNGFKIRTSNATVNASGTWIFGAWGDVPFKYNNTF